MVGDPGLLAVSLEQGYEAFLGKLKMTVAEADGTWSRVQAGTGLLRLCALPRFLDFFQALPPAATAAFAERADGATQETYEKLLTAKLTTTPQQTQAALPARLGWGGGWSLALQGVAGSGLAWVLAGYATGHPGSCR